MARLIRMDRTGHTTLAEWTAEDDAAFATAVRGVPRAAGARLHRHGAGRAGQGHARARASARGRPGDHAPADRRRLGGAPARPFPSSPRFRGASPTDARWLRRWGRIWHAWTLLYTVPFIAAGGGDDLARAARRAGGARRARARLDHPRAVRVPGRDRRAAEGPRATRPRRAGRAGPARRPARPRRARAPARDRAGARARRAGRLARRRGRRAARDARRPARALLLRARRPTASCRRPTASPTCCSRCARTRRASPRWRTTPSPARPGACAGACPRAMRPALDAARRARRARRVASRPWPYDVVIAGGGFGGLYAARRLERRLPRHSARITARLRRELPALHAAAAGRGGGLARAAPRGRAAARGARVGGPPARPRDRRRPRPCNELHVAPSTAATRRSTTTSWSSRSGRSRGCCRCPGLAEHGARLQDARRRDRAAQPRAAQPRDRRVAARRRGPARVPDLRVRRRRLRGRGGHRRAAGLRGRRDRPLPALPRWSARASILVEARDRIMPEIPASLAEFATRELRAARHGDPHRHDASSAMDETQRRALDRRARPDAARCAGPPA